MTRSTLLRNLTLTVVGFVVYLGVISIAGPFRDYQLATSAAYLCATAGLTVLIGLSGQLSIGHGALMAVGAYTVALLQNKLAGNQIAAQWTLPVSLLTGIVTAIIVGAVIGVAAARLRGPYLAGLTLVVAVAAPTVATVWSHTFHGDQGLPVSLPNQPAALGANYPPERYQALQAGIAAALVLFLLGNLMRGRFGRTLRAVRDDEVAARLSGVNIARAQILAFVVSAGCAGLGGGMLAVLSQSVTPSAYSLTLSLNLLLAVVIGGLGSLAGAVWGSLLLVFLTYWADSFTNGLHLPNSVATRMAGNLPLAIFGVLLIIVMITAPGGVQGLVRRAGNWALAQWRARGVQRRPDSELTDRPPTSGTEAEPIDSGAHAETPLDTPTKGAHTP